MTVKDRETSNTTSGSQTSVEKRMKERDAQLSLNNALHLHGDVSCLESDCYRSVSVSSVSSSLSPFTHTHCPCDSNLKHTYSIHYYMKSKHEL